MTTDVRLESATGSSDAGGASPTTSDRADLTRQRGRRGAWVLLALALLLLLPFLFFGYVLPLTPGRMARPSAALIEQFPLWVAAGRLGALAPDKSLLAAGGLLAFTVIAFALYALALYVARNVPAGRTTLALVVAASAAYFLLSALNLPNTTTDLFNYIVRGRLAAVHDRNPYYTAADEFPDDPYYPFASQQYTQYSGGKLPAWMVLNILLAALAGDHVVTGLLTYRLALLAFNLLNVILIVAILWRLQSSLIVAGAIFYGWNPIVVIFGQNKRTRLWLPSCCWPSSCLYGSRGNRPGKLPGSWPPFLWPCPPSSS